MVKEPGLPTLGKFVFVNFTHTPCTTGLCDPSSTVFTEDQKFTLRWHGALLRIPSSCSSQDHSSLWALIELRIQVECGCLVMVCPRSKVSGLVPWAGMSQKHASTGGCYSDKSTTQMLTIPAGK